MDKVECMRAFVETVRRKSFVGAAQALNVPRSTVSKQVQALEEAIGARLLMRTTRSLHLTESGEEYFESARQLLAEIEEVEQRARERVGTLRGVLRVNAPMSFGLRKLGSLFLRFHELHPLIELQLVLSDQLLDLVQEGFDVTIRIADLVDSSMIARTIAPAPRYLVASPTYLKKAGIPQTPEALRHHDFLGYGYLQSGISITLSQGEDIRHVHLTGTLQVNNGDILAQAAEAGMGIALLPGFIVSEALADGRLVMVLDDWLAPPININAIYPSARCVPHKTRAFIDFLLKELSPHRGYDR